MHDFNGFLKNGEGATALEYALIAALVSVAGVVAMAALGSGVEGLWGQVNGAM